MIPSPPPEKRSNPHPRQSYQNEDLSLLATHAIAWKVRLLKEWEPCLIHSMQKDGKVRILLPCVPRAPPHAQLLNIWNLIKIVKTPLVMCFMMVCLANR